MLFFNIIFRIVIPSILFSALEFFPSCLIQSRQIDFSFFLFKTLGGGTYWFTSALVVSELILLILFCTRIRNIWFYVVVCLTLGLIGLVIVKYNSQQNGIWAWQQGMIALIFLAIGGLYWRYETQVDKFRKWWVWLLLLIIYIVAIFSINNNNPLISTLGIQPLFYYEFTCLPFAHMAVQIVV